MALEHRAQCAIGKDRDALETLVLTNKYLNNMIEQDHRMVKQRCYPIPGFKTSGNAEVTLSGIELANKIKKGQFDKAVSLAPILIQKRRKDLSYPSLSSSNLSLSCLSFSIRRF